MKESKFEAIYDSVLKESMDNFWNEESMQKRVDFYSDENGHLDLEHLGHYLRDTA